MADKNLTYEQEQDVESHASMYLKVWVALLVLTILEYSYASFLKVSFLTLVVGLMVLALIKAGLVGWYFMHLKFEGNWVYGMLIPACFLMFVLVFALYPDIGAQKTAWPDYADDEEAAVQPAPLPAHDGPPPLVLAADTRD